MDQGRAFVLPSNTCVFAAATLYKAGDSISIVQEVSSLWDRVGSNILVKDTVIECKKKSWQNGTAVVGKALTITPTTKGKCRWNFKILKGTQVTVGVVNNVYNPSLHEYLNKTNNGWGYYQGDGKVGHGGPASKVYGKQYKCTRLRSVLVSG